VTFRAPFIEKRGTNAVGLKGISVRAKVRIDGNWSLETDGKGRAFPSQFIAAIADSEIIFGISNQGRSKIKTNILLPFDASETNGTGFKEPLSITVSSGGKPVRIFRGPELARGMMRLRSFRIPVEIPAESTIDVEIMVSHPLAVNPAWFQFICTDRYAGFANYRSLTTAGCGLKFEFDFPEETLKDSSLTLQRYLWFRFFQLPFSVRKISAVVFLLNKDYQVESVVNIILLQREDHFQQNSKLRHSNTRCFFSPI